MHTSWLAEETPFLLCRLGLGPDIGRPILAIAYSGPNAIGSFHFLSVTPQGRINLRGSHIAIFRESPRGCFFCDSKEVKIRRASKSIKNKSKRVQH